MTPGPCSLGDAWWERTLALAAPFTAALSNLPPESAQELEAKVKASGQQYQADDGSLAFPATVNVASARRPS